MLRKEDAHADWFVVDATDMIVGRLATKLATVLMGKHKPTYTPHVNCGDFIIVLNTEKVRFTGKPASHDTHTSYTEKMAKKEYDRYTGYPGGRRVETGESLLERKPAFILHEAVRRMLPKNKLGDHMLKRLKLVVGDKHEHQAQQPQEMPAHLLP